MPQLNGKTTLTLTIAGALAVVVTAFTAGVSYNTVSSHAANTAVHELPDAKTKRIDDRIKLHMRPIEVQLIEMNKKIDRILDGNK